MPKLLKCFSKKSKAPAAAPHSSSPTSAGGQADAASLSASAAIPDTSQVAQAAAAASVVQHSSVPTTHDGQAATPAPATHAQAVAAPPIGHHGTVPTTADGQAAFAPQNYVYTPLSTAYTQAGQCGASTVGASGLILGISSNSSSDAQSDALGRRAYIDSTDPTIANTQAGQSGASTVGASGLILGISSNSSSDAQSDALGRRAFIDSTDPTIAGIKISLIGSMIYGETHGHRWLDRHEEGSTVIRINGKASLFYWGGRVQRDEGVRFLSTKYKPAVNGNKDSTFISKKMFDEHLVTPKIDVRLDKEEDIQHNLLHMHLFEDGGNHVLPMSVKMTQSHLSMIRKLTKIQNFTGNTLTLINKVAQFDPVHGPVAGQATDLISELINTVAGVIESKYGRAKIETGYDTDANYITSSSGSDTYEIRTVESKYLIGQRSTKTIIKVEETKKSSIDYLKSALKELGYFTDLAGPYAALYLKEITIYEPGHTNESKFKLRLHDAILKAIKNFLILNSHYDKIFITNNNFLNNAIDNLSIVNYYSAAIKVKKAAALVFKDKLTKECSQSDIASARSALYELIQLTGRQIAAYEDIKKEYEKVDNYIGHLFQVEFIREIKLFGKYAERKVSLLMKWGITELNDEFRTEYNSASQSIIPSKIREKIEKIGRHKIPYYMTFKHKAKGLDSMTYMECNVGLAKNTVFKSNTKNFILTNPDDGNFNERAIYHGPLGKYGFPVNLAWLFTCSTSLKTAIETNLKDLKEASNGDIRLTEEQRQECKNADEIEDKIRELELARLNQTVQPSIVATMAEHVPSYDDIIFTQMSVLVTKNDQKFTSYLHYDGKPIGCFNVEFKIVLDGEVRFVGQSSTTSTSMASTPAGSGAAAGSSATGVGRVNTPGVQAAPHSQVASKSGSAAGTSASTTTIAQATSSATQPASKIAGVDQVSPDDKQKMVSAGVTESKSNKPTSDLTLLAPQPIMPADDATSESSVSVKKSSILSGQSAGVAESKSDRTANATSQAPAPIKTDATDRDTDKVLAKKADAKVANVSSATPAADTIIADSKRIVETPTSVDSPEDKRPLVVDMLDAGIIEKLVKARATDEELKRIEVALSSLKGAKSADDLAVAATSSAAIVEQLPNITDREKITISDRSADHISAGAAAEPSLDLDVAGVASQPLG